MNLAPILEKKQIHVCVPCRIDFGGTLDISTFYLPLAALKPATLNLALDMRTHVYLSAWEQGRIKISSKGFDTIDRSRGEKGWDGPMGLMFAVFEYFNVHGVHLHIESKSPVRSALGGSSCAAVAIIAAVYTALEKQINPEHIAWLAHYLEGAVAGVLCGVQDQAAAAFGGVNLWEWTFGHKSPEFVRCPVFDSHEKIEKLNRHLLVAYCGIPHESRDVNARWVSDFKSGRAYDAFERITRLTRQFAGALGSFSFKEAARLMNQETAVRCEMTPDVLDHTGIKLWYAAKSEGCGARFTGAGGGGCLWAIGEETDIDKLKTQWEKILDPIDGAMVLNAAIDPKGICVH
ncbi:GHMP family kinase ATP-binding protein [Desulfobacter postgatei]|uniref:Putative kinase, galactokinase/mevalonate kinase n=1 Tax=Desulfobacter postgatei 2ac9 TaxID=879212 RepID=I5B0N8_9BACT|nr:galactokinase [Desulfobacter postgatei]EIM63051.1 putative kinase, galactokinase/mevalonate kinase [Desulfobacter postgatei 2ac9]